ncbi:DUF2975 domain-containing protein [Ekhidna sp.]|uniref:DUF2975 domain-containing protein n=1 Tax=Ekhidna sp. TaxID=2608089 RepID=UPI003C7D3FF2
MNNNLLRLATFAARIILALDILLGLILVFFMIAWPLELSFLEKIHMVQDSSIFTFETEMTTDRGVPLTPPLSEFGAYYFYFTCVRSLTMVVILFRIIQLSIRIIKSISSVETFRFENVFSFRKMGQLFLIWFVVAIPSIKPLTEFGETIGLTMTASLDLKYALFALVCFVLAEIFKEGNKLMEENKLTI